jgi:hypothetical protein
MSHDRLGKLTSSKSPRGKVLDSILDVYEQANHLLAEYARVSNTVPDCVTKRLAASLAAWRSDLKA